MGKTGLCAVQGNFNNGEGTTGLPGLQGPPGPQVAPPLSHVTGPSPVSL